ncbi:transposon Ty3-I Gag-Pol polyprotein [Nephila pilipes]|uniref:Transposon Ty3-I Gag-Pol polyprotein n=1 Tax=Nephila pilipes TaxID=299642 RepID=A0A8X6N9T3_NEPPI|nr:transposon Ty3-I Gag-Pol polyprotein [Nephila pilipes]
MIGSLPSSEEKSFCIILIDRFTQWPEAIPVLAIQKLAHLLRLKRKGTTVYNPASNEFVERWHRSLKTAITCHGHMPNTWRTRALPTVLLGLHSINREEFKCTPAECVYRTNVLSPNSTCSSEFVKELKQHFADLKPVPA